MERCPIYLKWVTSTVTRVNGKTQKPITVTLTTKKQIPRNTDEAVILFRKDLAVIMAHEFRITHKRTALKGETNERI